MKMLTTLMVLMIIPFTSHAEWNNHFRHQSHHQERNSSYFWQDIDHRLNRQDARIERGIEQGQLTRREIRKLKREQRHVAKQVRHLKRHDYLSHDDKREVSEHLGYVSNKIRKLKHNEHYVHRERNHYSHNSRAHRNDRYSNFYRNDRHLSWANNNSSVGLYFRF